MLASWKILGTAYSRFHSPKRIGRKKQAALVTYETPSSLIILHKVTTNSGTTGRPARLAR
jgi:hypothetical protein